MKIRKIKFENINSLRGEHEIDFTASPLEQSRLFAITGPTGSGKSTILDVVVLALFNRVPRLGKVSKNYIEQSGALLTRNTQQASANVDYECSQGVFRSSWSISLNRNGNLRDYEMEIVNIQSDQILDLKKRDVPGRNEELIGLNYEQFVKSIMLAQGDFAQFLKVDKSKRGELLEKITGTGIYRKLGQKAYEKKNLYAQELEDLKKKRETYRESLMEEEQLRENKERDEALEARYTQKEKELKKIDEQLKLRSEVAKLTRQKEEQEAQHQKNEKSLREFREQYQKTLQRHEATFPFVEPLEKWKSLKEKATENSREQEEVEQSLQKLKKKRSNTLAEVEQLLQKKMEEAAVKEELHQFQDRVQQLEQQIKDKQSDYRSSAKELETKGESWGYKPDSKKPEAELEQLQKQKASAKKEIANLQEELRELDTENPEGEDARLEEKLQALQSVAQWSKDLQKLRDNRKKEQEALKEAAAELETLPEQITEFEKELKQATLEAENIQLKIDKQKLEASLEDHRAKLEEGKPCPLCGSVEHPYAAHAPEPDDELQEKLAAAQKREKDFNKKQLKAEERKKSLEKYQSDQEARFKDLDSQVSELDQKLQEELQKWSLSQNENWSAAISKTKAIRKSLRNYKDLEQNIRGMEQCIPVLEQMITIAAEGKELAEQKKKLFSGKDVAQTCGNLRDAWLELNQQLQNAKERKQQLENAAAELKKQRAALEEELTPALKQAGFEGIEDALAKRLPDSKYQNLQQEQNKLQKAINTSETTVKTLAENLLEKQKELSDDSEEEVKEQREQINALLAQLKEEWDEVRRGLKNHAEFLKKIEAIQEQIEREEKTGRKWALLNELIGDATGKKFNDFAQDLTLQQLLALANNRLSQLTDRYRVASPTEEEDDSLIAIDEHMGGQRRSVKTLSGGETFLLSLALALALSDLASRNVEINSLFIDEGFGTLDPETLDQTLDTLEKLQTESSKTIGIISHVEALKERIQTQIQLERDGQGLSTLRVRG